MSALVEAREPDARYLVAGQPALVRQFELLTTAPGGVARLRELILLLAVRGKLVSQDPSDETAQETLKGIRGERERLISTGVIKAPKQTKGAGGDELPFELPPSWGWAPLAELVRVLNGRAYSKQELLDTGPTPVLRVGNLFTSDHWYYSNLRLDPDKLCSSGDLLFAWSASFGPFIWDGPEAIFHYHIWKLDPIAPELFDTQFFHLFLREKTAELKAAGHGVSMVHLTKEKMEKIPVPWPPLAEQARIVARVDELMQLCDALEAKGRLEAQQHARLLETLLGTLTDSTTSEELAASWQRVAEHFDFLLDRPEAVDVLEQTALQLGVRGLLVAQREQEEPADVWLERLKSAQASVAGARSTSTLPADLDQVPFPLPSGWAWSSLSELCSITGGATPSKAVASNWSGDIPWVSPKDMKVPIIEDAQDHVSSSALKGSLSLIQPGSLLMVVRGMILAHSFPVAVTRVPVTINQDMKALTPLDSSVLPYLSLVCMGMKPEILAMVERSTHGTCKLASAKIFSLPIPLPPLCEQARIVARVTELRRLCADLRQRLAASQSTQSRLAEALVAAEG